MMVGQGPRYTFTLEEISSITSAESRKQLRVIGSVHGGVIAFSPMYRSDKSRNRRAGRCLQLGLAVPQGMGIVGGRGFSSLYVREGRGIQLMLTQSGVGTKLFRLRHFPLAQSNRLATSKTCAIFVQLLRKNRSGNRTSFLLLRCS